MACSHVALDDGAMPVATAIRESFASVINPGTKKGTLALLALIVDIISNYPAHLRNAVNLWYLFRQSIEAQSQGSSNQLETALRRACARIGAAPSQNFFEDFRAIEDHYKVEAIRQHLEYVIHDPTTAIHGLYHRQIEDATTSPR